MNVTVTVIEGKQKTFLGERVKYHKKGTEGILFLIFFKKTMS